MMQAKVSRKIVTSDLRQVSSIRVQRSNKLAIPTQKSYVKIGIKYENIRTNYSAQQSKLQKYYSIIKQRENIIKQNNVDDHLIRILLLQYLQKQQQQKQCKGELCVDLNNISSFISKNKIKDILNGIFASNASIFLLQEIKLDSLEDIERVEKVAKQMGFKIKIYSNLNMQTETLEEDCQLVIYCDLCPQEKTIDQRQKRSRKLGVAIAVKRGVGVQVQNKDIFLSGTGRLLGLKVNFLREEINLVSVYAPNQQSERRKFIKYKLDEFLKKMCPDIQNQQNLLVGGDFNLVLESWEFQGNTIGTRLGGRKEMEKLVEVFQLEQFQNCPYQLFKISMGNLSLTDFSFEIEATLSLIILELFLRWMEGRIRFFIKLLR